MKTLGDFSCLPQVCVSECPAENWFFTNDESIDRRKLFCRNNVDPLDTSKKIFDLIKDGECAYYYVESKSCECESWFIKYLIFTFSVSTFSLPVQAQPSKTTQESEQVLLPDNFLLPSSSLSVVHLLSLLGSDFR